MCWESEAEEKGISTEAHITANVKKGDKVRVIAKNEDSIYGRHHLDIGQEYAFVEMHPDGKGIRVEYGDYGLW